MQKNSVFGIAVCGMLAAGCGGGENPYIAAQRLENMPEAKYLAKVVYKDGGDYNYNCSAVSLGGGRFLTSAKCVGRTTYIADISEKLHKADSIKTGHDYASGTDWIETWHKNYAVLYAPTLHMPPAVLGNSAPQVTQRVCVIFSAEYSKKFSPVKHCGKILEHLEEHYTVRWDGIEKITGYWGAPVFYETGEDAGKLAGIVSYQFNNDITGGGIFPVNSIKGEIE